MDEQAAATIEAQEHQDVQNPLRRRLGRGLNALIGGGVEAATEGIPAQGEAERTGRVTTIDVQAIEANPFQPRHELDQETLKELAESIKQHGLLQPLLVRPLQEEGRFQLIAGQRRWLAAREAGLQEVPCQIQSLEDKSACEVALEENLKRQDLNVLDKARAFQDYIERFDSSIEELARQLSMSRSAVSNMIRLLELPEAVHEALRREALSAGHARALLPLNEDDQRALCRRIEQEGLSVRKTEQAVRAVQKNDASGQKQTDQSSKPQPSNHILSLQEQLREHLGVKAEIRLRDDEAGRIVLPFRSNEEFEHLLGHLRPAG